MRTGRLSGLAGCAALAVLAPAAAGFWTAPGAGGASAAAGTLTPATISTPTTATGEVTLTWTAQSSAPAGGSLTYRVERRVGSGVYAPVSAGGCSGALPQDTTSCTDAPPTAGSYSYRAVAVLNSWTAVSNEAGPVSVSVDATPPTVVSINRTGAALTSSASASWTVSFSEPVTGVDAADFALVRGGDLTGGAVTSVSGSGTTRSVTASTGTGSGTLGLNLVDDDSIADTATLPNPLGGAGAGNGDATGQTYTLDRTAPALTSLEMRDVDSDGKVDRLTATFDETVASSTATAPWSLADVPSAGALSSVSTSGATATLTLTEGAGAAYTAVGPFRVALAASASGIRDALGNQASFSATAPLDLAGPVPVALVDTNGLLDGRLETGNTLAATFSEALAGGIPASPTITEARPASGNATLDISGFTNGPLSMGSANYLLAPGSVTVPGTAALSNGSRRLTITAGTCTLGCASLGTGTGTTMVYLPAPTLVDAAGNSATGSRSSGFRVF